MTDSTRRRSILGLTFSLLAATSGLLAAAAAGASPVNSASPLPAGGSASPASVTGTSFPGAGLYTDGPSGAPHYQLEVTQSSATQLAGDVKLVHQDGTSAPIMSFTAKPSGGAFPLAAQPATGRPTAEFDGSAIELPGCSSYLKLARSASSCRFTTSASAPPSASQSPRAGAAATTNPSCIYTPTDFANAFLNAIPEPDSAQNVEAIVGWEEAEGGNWYNTAKFNPLNTTEPWSGSVSVNGVGVQAYQTWADGVAATVATITSGYYPGILSALAAGNSATSVAQAVGNSPWGTPDYSDLLPPSYNPPAPSWETPCTPNPVTISTGSLARGDVGIAYSEVLAASGGTGGDSWSVAGGSLPSGVTLTASGSIQGTPRAAGTFPLVVKVTDSAGATATASLPIGVAPGFDLLQNASGDAGGNLGGWVISPVGGGVVNLAAYDNGTGHQSRYFMETNTSVAGGSIYQNVDPPVGPGQSYTFSTWVRARGTAQVCLELTGEGPQPQHQGETCASVGEQWVNLSTEFDAPGGQSYSGLRAQVVENTPGVNVDLDGAELLSDALQNASGDAGGYLGGWNLNPVSGGSVNLAAYANGTGHQNDYFMETNTSAAGGAVSQDLAGPLAAGQSYTFSAWVRATGTADACLQLTGLAPRPESQGATCSRLGDTWVHMSTEFDVPANQPYTALRAALVEDTPGVNVDLDGAEVSNNGLANASGDAGGDLGGWVMRPTAGGVVNLAAYANGTGYQNDYFMETNTSAPGGAVTQDLTVPLAAGQSYTYSAWVRARGPAKVCLELAGVAPRVELQGGACTTVSTSWVRLSSQFDVPGDQPYTGLRAKLVEQTPGVNVDLDGSTLGQ